MVREAQRGGSMCALYICARRAACCRAWYSALLRDARRARARSVPLAVVMAGATQTTNRSKHTRQLLPTQQRDHGDCFTMEVEGQLFVG